MPHFAISIALEREGTIVAGLIYNPANDELFIAERGKGAFLNDRRIRVAARKRLADAVIACGAAASRPRRSGAVPARTGGDPGQGRRPATVRRGRARPRLCRGRPVRRLLGAQPFALGFRGRPGCWCARPAASSPISDGGDAMEPREHRRRQRDHPRAIAGRC